MYSSSSLHTDHLVMVVVVMVVVAEMVVMVTEMPLCPGKLHWEENCMSCLTQSFCKVKIHLIFSARYVPKGILIDLAVNFAQHKAPWGGNIIHWRISQVRLTCGHVYEGSVALIVYWCRRTQPLWAVASLGRWSWHYISQEHPSMAFAFKLLPWLSSRMNCDLEVSDGINPFFL